VALNTTGLARRQLGFLVLALFWFWVGSGWGGAFNPWHLFQRIPLLNNVHVQSRVFILMYLFLIAAIFLGLEALTRRRQWKRAHLAFCALLVGESLVVHNYPFVDYQSRDIETLQSNLITLTTITGTQREGRKPSQYFSGTGSLSTYEPF